jgi:hypothetical protein
MSSFGSGSPVPEIAARHSSLGGKLGERIAVVKDAKHRLSRREP